MNHVIQNPKKGDKIVRKGDNCILLVDLVTSKFVTYKNLTKGKEFRVMRLNWESLKIKEVL